MSTYFVKGTYQTNSGYTSDFDIVFDLRPVTAENFLKQVRKELGISSVRSIYIENVVKL